MKFLAVKDFWKFQHYRDRRPPWIKFHATVLTDASIAQLPEAAQAQLFKLWLLASQFGHPLPNNPKLLAGKIGVMGKFHLKALIAAGFLIPCNEFASTDASTALDENEENASPSVRARSQSTEDRERTTETPRDDSGPIPEPELTAVYLTVWANGAITERWGEQINPLTQAGAIELAADLRKLGVDWRIARLSIYRQCRESGKNQPPRSVNYFRNGILEDSEAQQSRSALERSGERPPADAETAGVSHRLRGRRPQNAGEETYANAMAALEGLPGGRP